MSYPVFRKGFSTFATDAAGRAGSPRAEEIASISSRAMNDAGAYVISEELAQAINVALILGMPLLVTGEPGTGKTELGRAIAHELDAGQPLTFETKSTSQARDLFYTYDALGRFAAKEIGGDVRAQSYIRYHALGLAILNAFPREQVGHLLSETTTHSGPKRSVVVIDEIDKAPRDFTNDLLNEIARMAFRVPELGNLATPGMDGGDAGLAPTLRPIVIITSNSERGLPDPFLRRCVYFHIPFPESAALRDIVARRVEGVDAFSDLVSDALDLFARIRDDHSQPIVQKKPGTAELLNWLQFLVARGYVGKRLRTPEASADVAGSVFALAKTQDDLEAVKAFIPTWCARS